MKIREIISEGGWASTETQGTKITPSLVANVMTLLQREFMPALNKFLAANNLPECAITAPAGSATYYQRDLKQDPTREYGDVDVQMSIPRIDGTTNSANAAVFQKAVKEFCDSVAGYSTSNGTNVIMRVGQDVVQVDLIMSYYENQNWLKTLAPEWRVKGVLCNSLYSSLGEALDLSFGGAHGVQVKMQGNRRVPFRTIKDVELQTITNRPDTWAVDIARYLGCKTLSPILKDYPGTLDEVRTRDIVMSFKGIAESLEINGLADSQELLDQVREIYLNKIDKAINSTKFDKASTPEAVAKATATKETLAKKSAEIAGYFN